MLSATLRLSVCSCLVLFLPPSSPQPLPLVRDRRTHGVPGLIGILLISLFSAARPSPGPPAQAPQSSRPGTVHLSTLQVCSSCTCCHLMPRCCQEKARARTVTLETKTFNSNRITGSCIIHQKGRQAYQVFF